MAYCDNGARKARKVKEKNNLSSLLEKISPNSRRQPRSTLLHCFLNDVSHWIIRANEIKEEIWRWLFNLIRSLRQRRKIVRTKAQKKRANLDISKSIRRNSVIAEQKREMKIAIVKQLLKLIKIFLVSNFKITCIQAGLKSVAKSCSSILTLQVVHNIKF